MSKLSGIGPKRFKKFAGIEFWFKNVREDGSIEFGRPMAWDLFDTKMPEIAKRVTDAGLTVVSTSKGSRSRNAFESIDFGFIVVKE